MLEVGKLYSCSKYFLLLYPDKETAADDLGIVGIDRLADAAYWSKRLGISYCNTETPLLVISVNEKYVEVLAGDQKGWIINEDWLEIKEIVNEAA